MRISLLCVLLACAVLPFSATAQFGVIELNPRDTAGSSSTTRQLVCTDQYGQKVPSCCVNFYNGWYSNSGGHDHLQNPGSPISTVTMSSSCYYNNGSINVSIQTSPIGQGEYFGFCSNACAETLLISRYKEYGLYYLTQLPASGAHYNRVGSTTLHVNGWYGTTYVVQALQNIASDYAATPNGHTIGINDMSLVHGGIFDYRGTWTTPHSRHRTGLDTDVTYRVGGGGDSIADLPAFQAKVAQYGGDAQVHCAGGNPGPGGCYQHVHVVW